MKETYKELVSEYAPRPLHSDKQHEIAMKVLDKMVGFRMNSDQKDYVEAVATFVERYETVKFGEPKSSPVECLKLLLECNDMNYSDLGRLLGNRTLGSAIMTGKRQLSKNHMKILSKRFCVSTDLFFDKD